jgi:hypothetical protein
MTTLLEPPVTVAAQHAELLRAVVVARMLRRLAESTEPATRENWLEGYAAELAIGLPSGQARDQIEQWWVSRLNDFELTASEPTPMRQLDREDALLVSAACLIEDDIRFGSLFAALQAPLASRRPCIGLLSWLLADPFGDRAVALRCQKLARRGILEVTNIADPRAEWVVKVPSWVCELVQSGRVSADALPAGLQLHAADSFPPLEEIWVSDDVVADVQALPNTLAQQEFGAVVVRGLSRSGRRTLLGSTARELGWDLLGCDQATASEETWRAFGALAALGPIFPVIRCQPSYDETCLLPELPEIRRTVGIVAGPAGGLQGELLRRPLTISLNHCDETGRRQLWIRSGLQPETDELAEITESFLLTPGNVMVAADLARAGAAVADRGWVTADDVRVAVGQLHRGQLEPLATRLDPLLNPRPVLDQPAEEELDTLLLRCRHREQLAARGVTADRGVRALFSGPSGTGKTLAARYLAGRLSLDIYRINLASVVNKYIGVTERNLDRVLSVAEEIGVMLLLDEGDALMARRTEVNDANDRYANLETNYLLQRFESFSGIVLVTSNAASRIDAAFLRRIDVTVDFLPPNPEQRWLIWESHLPTEHQISDQLLIDIARRCPLTGGVIRNATLHASLLALDDGVPVADRHLLVALRREYRRAGGTCPIPE